MTNKPTFFCFQKKLLPAAVAAAATTLSLAPMIATADPTGETDGEYRTGDFHNHTSCSDGSTSVKTLTREALMYHDWFIHVGHSGRGPRDCRVSDFLYHAFGGGSRVGLWTNTLEPGSIKGDERLRDFTITNADGTEVTQTVQDMWRWQSLQEYNLPQIVEERELPYNDEQNKVAFLGLEWVVPGHEHSSNSISTGQYEEEPNADALAQFEYCFARNSDDTSGGGGQGWTCEISDAYNDKLKELFAGRPEEGIADYNSTLVDGINIEDTGEHVKSVAAVLWKKENFAADSFTVQAHVERQGAFVPDDDEGWNVEHMRDMHTVAPEIAVGFESQPGHQAQFNRGSYNAGRPTAGLYTYGGTGAYAGAEVSRPGLDFDGTPLTEANCPADADCTTPEAAAKVVLGRPGVRTMWDAMLSEGRKFYFYGSSDWHNRGSFGPLDFESTNDFWPGEYQDNFVYIRDEHPDDPARDVVNGIKSGNVFVVQGQLIDRMRFRACTRRGGCATMGETLKVRPGELVWVVLNVRDPKRRSNSPYSFDNPSLLQMGIEQPLNRPELAHVELIKGNVYEQFTPADAEYYEPMAPNSTRIVQQWTPYDWNPGRAVKRMAWAFRAYGDSYLRARGSNIPPGTPNERDWDGNPLPDNLTDNIPCTDIACPPHIEGVLNADVEAWADIWFYSNPIFIEVDGEPRNGRRGNGI